MTERSPLVVSAGEAAGLLGLGINTVYAMCARGELRAARVGRRYLIPRTEVVGWLHRSAGITEQGESAERRYDALFASQTKDAGGR